MKKVVIITLLLAYSFYGVAQQIESPRHPAPQVVYMKKCRNQKTAAWVLISAGAIGVSVTAWIEELDPNIDYTVPYVASFAAIAASVPLFISAAKNKREARAAAYMKMEQVPTWQTGTFKSNAYPSVALRVPL